MKLHVTIASVILALAIVNPEYVITNYKDVQSEEYLWSIVQENSPNDYVAAGIMGYFWRESFYRSDAVAGWGVTKATSGVDPCEDFTKQLDESNREEFVELIRSVGGYGLGQWYAEGHLESLYDFCKGYNTSFADAEMQCLFTIHICTTDPYIWDTLKDATNAHDAGLIIGHLHDGSKYGSPTIASKAEQIYRERCQ